MTIRKLLAALPAILACLPLCAQSYVVNPDNTVTFNYRNESAGDVKVSVQFAGTCQMVKGPDGVWSATVGPAAPDIYPYCFIVDGVSVMDPENPEFFPNETFKNSLLDMDTQAANIYAVKDVPHGNVDYINYFSENLGLHGRAIVYTPPFYDRNADKKYPVFYLISGTTDTEEVYFKVGKMNFILDNLIAQGAAEEMIVVLPYGNPSKYFPDGSIDFRSAGDLFSIDLARDLMPYVESHYRTINDREHRAIGGFSRGGNQGLAFGLTHLRQFSYLCSYSSFTSMVLPGGVYDDADRLNRDIKLFWLGVGTDDFLYGNAREYMEFLDAKGINNVKYFTTDKFGHTWMNARHFLDKTLRLLFKDCSEVPSDPLPALVKEEGKEEQKLTPAVMARLFPTPVVSPEINIDGSVTFRVRADEAKDVQLECQMFEGTRKMEKDAKGIWTVSLTAPKPDIYQYVFVIDGTKVADPCNMYICPGKGFKYSLVDVPAPAPTVQDVQRVPQGTVTYRFGCNACIYTPAGYEPAGKEELPVLYLLPGECDTAESWSKVGRANVILDNLSAIGKAARILVVMPDGPVTPELVSYVKENYSVSEEYTIDSFMSSNSHTWIEAREHLQEILK